jgi:hypothetical protein
MGKTGNAVLIHAATVNLQGIAFQKTGITARMIPMVMGIENRHKVDTFLLDLLYNRFTLRRIHDGGLMGLLTHDEIRIVIPKARNLYDFHASDL